MAYAPGYGWGGMGGAGIRYSSLSSSVTDIVLYNPQISRTEKAIGSRVDNHRLHNLMTQSPHAPVAGCSSTTAFLNASSDDVNWYRRLVLTDASHAFVAWVQLVELPMVGDPVGVTVYTTEPPVSGVGEAFKNRHPVTTRLARVALGSAVARMIFDR
ncbi:unnamed protein product [Vitrella brassicaformis CCMP3155]|uniref:Uncharacterized protein n=1 Tax=Vitrella brassicaformis (strain CCMP3155) TaxID=1169540 RepID=A0A0G4FUA7_VITBC|nr:unnamed protein product [Vitrella brassicaformis CCMP3155]|eukprot:CEM18292.1 unnamed protein product [Vitrella brassicaformis CCMP3155]